MPIRKIMRLANAGLGLMNYYFESKDALLEAVIATGRSMLTQLGAARHSAVLQLQPNAARSRF